MIEHFVSFINWQFWINITWYIPCLKAEIYPYIISKFQSFCFHSHSTMDGSFKNMQTLGQFFEPLYYLAVLPAFINFNSIPTHLKTESIISLLYKPSTLIILTVTQPSPEVNIYMYPQPVYSPSTQFFPFIHHHYQ